MQKNDFESDLPPLTWREWMIEKYLLFHFLFRRGGWRSYFLLWWVPFRRNEVYQLEKKTNWLLARLGINRQVIFLDRKIRKATLKEPPPNGPAC